MDAKAAAEAGHRHLAAWLRDVEAKWRTDAAKRVDGSPRMTLLEQLDHMRGLLAQFGIRLDEIGLRRCRNSPCCGGIDGYKTNCRASGLLGADPEHG